MFINICNLVEHGCRATGLFPDHQHLRNHRRKPFGFAQLFAQGASLDDFFLRLLDLIGQYDIAHDLAGDFQRVYERKASLQQRCHRAAKASNGSFYRCCSEDRDFQRIRFDKQSPLWLAEEIDDISRLPAMTGIYSHQ